MHSMTWTVCHGYMTRYVRHIGPEIMQNYPIDFIPTKYDESYSW